MAFHKKVDYIFHAGLLTVIFITLPLVSTENVDCKGKAFHCVNSTHFKVCVDFGGGVSKTVDEFLIPCPKYTVCRETNRFECEYQVTTTLAPTVQSDATNEEEKLSDTSVWIEVEVTSPFPQKKPNKTEERNNSNISSIITTELSTTFIPSETSENIFLTTSEGIPSQVNLSGENKKHDQTNSVYSDSDTYTYAPVSYTSLVANNAEITTISSKVNYISPNIELHTKNSEKLPLTTSSLNEFQDKTELNIDLINQKNSSKINNSSEYYIDNSLSTLSTQIERLSSLSGMYENLTSNVDETASVTNNLDTLTTPNSNSLNIDFFSNDSSTNLLISATTAESYTTTRKYETVELIDLNITDKPFYNVNRSDAASNFNFDSNVLRPENIINNASTENSLSKSSTNPSFIHEIQVTDSEKQILQNNNINNIKVESSNFHYNIDNNYTTLTINHNHTQNVETVTSSTIDANKYSKNRYAGNILKDGSSSIDTQYIISLNDSNSTIQTIAPINDYISNNLSNSHTTFDHLSLNQSDLNTSKSFFPNSQQIYLNVFGSQINNVTNETMLIESVPYSDSINLSIISPLLNDATHNVEDIFTNGNPRPRSNNTDFGVHKTTSIMDTQVTSLLIEIFNVTFPTDTFSVSKINTNATSITMNSLTASTTLSGDNQMNTSFNTEAHTILEKSTEHTNFKDKESITKVVDTTNFYFNQETFTDKVKELNFSPQLQKKDETYETTSNTKESISVRTATYDNLNMNFFPMTTSIEAKPIHPFSKNVSNDVDDTYNNKINLNLLSDININDNNEQAQSSRNPSSVNNVLLYTTQTIEENNIFNVSLNKVSTSPNTTNLIDFLIKTTIPELSYESKSNISTKFNEMISTTQTTIAVRKSFLLSTDHRDYQNKIDTTKPYFIQKDSTSKDFYSRNTNDQNHFKKNNNTTVYNLDYKHPPELNNLSKNKDVKASSEKPELEQSATYRSTVPLKKTTLSFLNNLTENSVDNITNTKNITDIFYRTTTLEESSSDTLRVKSGNKKMLNSTNIVKKITETLSNVENDLYKVDADIKNYTKKVLTVENKTTYSPESSKTIEIPMDNISLKSNKNLLLNQNVTDSKTRNVSSKKDDYFLEKPMPEKVYNDQNYNNRKRPAIINTVASISSELINNVPSLKNQTVKSPLISKFICPNRNRHKYSDKNDCSKFYICVGKRQPIIGMCPTGTVFSELKKQCTKNLSHCIRDTQFRCLSSGRFIDITSEQFYYVCVKKIEGYVRFKLQCQKGYHLNKKNIQCTSDVTSIENTSNINSSISKEISRSGTSEIRFDCEEEGKFDHPDDCRKYFVCTKNSKSKFRRKIKKCDSDEVFNKEKRKCVDSESYEC